MDDKPLRILQIMGTMDRGGAETLVMNIYRAIDKHKIQLDFVVHTNEKSDFDSEIEALGGIIYHAPRYKVINHFSYRKWWTDFFAKHNDYYVIHSHVRSTASIILRIAKERGIKTIAHSHSTSNGKGLTAVVKNYLQKSITKNADVLFACSNEAGKWLYGDKPFFVLKNGIDTSRFKPNIETREAYRHKLDINQDTFVCGHVGRFHEAKNHTFLISVFSEVLKQHPNSKLILVGDGELRKEIEKQIASFGIQESVILLGVRGDIPELLQAMDCFIFPSKWEGFPVSLLEAEASGLPCFASNTITKEVVLASNIKQLSIDEEPKKWADFIMQSDHNRLDNTFIIQNAGFDIAQEAEWIEHFYSNLQKNGNGLI